MPLSFLPFAPDIATEGLWRPLRRILDYGRQPNTAWPGMFSRREHRRNDTPKCRPALPLATFLLVCPAHDRSRAAESPTVFKRRR